MSETTTEPARRHIFTRQCEVGDVLILPPGATAVEVFHVERRRVSLTVLADEETNPPQIAK